MNHLKSQFQFLTLIDLTFWYELSVKPPELTIYIYKADRRGARIEGIMIPFPSVFEVENEFTVDPFAGF